MERDIALKKMIHYCDYQDRCKKEIFTKLDTFELDDNDRDFIIDFLQEEGSSCSDCKRLHKEQFLLHPVR